MKTIKRLFWLPIIIIFVIGWIVGTLPLLIIWGGEKLDNKFTTPLMNFCYEKMK